MTGRNERPALTGLGLIIIVILMWVVPGAARAAPYAAMVMDARSGQVLYAENADTPLHPASLTKMMTLYIAFEAVERGEIGLDTLVTIPRAAANEPPSKLGLRAGQTIRFRYLIRAAAVKSANDAATAIGIALEGSEAAFARRMTRTAQAMGMTRTHFKNAHGLTEPGHMSTARDMTILGRHMIYDWPQYYNLFSRRSTDAHVRAVNNTNTRFLDAYRGADGIKTGYTRAAGFNLVASAERGGERIIATVFGGASTADRNRRVAELLDRGFRQAPDRVALNRPQRPPYLGNVATARLGGAPARSLRPLQRPAVAVAVAASLPRIDGDVIADLLESVATGDSGPPAASEAAGAASPPAPAAGAAPGAPESVAVAPPSRPDEVVTAAGPDAEPEVVTRVSTSGGRHWGINVGRYGSRYQAERVLLQVALKESASLDGAVRRVLRGATGFDANFMGLTREGADLACRRLQARGTGCFMIEVGSS